MYSITSAGAIHAFMVIGVACPTYSITDAAQDEDGAGATSSVTGEGAVKVTVCAGAPPISFTGAGVARVTSGAGATPSVIASGSSHETAGCGRHVFRSLKQRYQVSLARTCT